MLIEKQKSRKKIQLAYLDVNTSTSTMVGPAAHDLVLSHIALGSSWQTLSRLYLRDDIMKCCEWD